MSNSSKSIENLNEFSRNVVDSLKAEGFEVEPSPSGKNALRVTWRNVWIGVVEKALCNQKRSPSACTYRFPKNWPHSTIAAAPSGFDKEEFARVHGCDPEMLKVDTSKNKGKVSLYLRIKDVATTLLLMRDWAKRIDETLFPPECSHAANTMMNDLRAILADTTKSETERLAELAVRLGQGKFRDDLQREFGNACAATGLTALPVLRASHIVPWRSDEAERLNPKNGLLLSANLDALFDRYMITFDPEGKLKISEFVTKRDQERLGPLPNLQSTPCDARAAFLRRHNAEFERRERQRFADVKASE